MTTKSTSKINSHVVGNFGEIFNLVILAKSAKFYYNLDCCMYTYGAKF